MIELKEDCQTLLVHIKKCTLAMDLDGYTYAGIVGYILRIPFKRMHRYHFAQIEMYTNKIMKYVEENNIDLNLENFDELENSSIIYCAEQTASLGYRDYEHRSKYLENLKKVITKLLERIEINDLSLENS